MASDRISLRTVNKLECPSGKDRVFLWDEDLSGFGVAAMPSRVAPDGKEIKGTKVYVVQYRQAGRSRRMKLGEHGRLTPDEARSLAKEILGDVEKGKDPIEQRRAKRTEQKFKALADGYMRLHVAAKCKKRTAEEYERLLRLHILPAIGAKSVSQVTKGDIARMHANMADKPAAAKSIRYFDQRVYVPEIGPACAVSSIEQLNEKVSAHLSNQALDGLAAHDFRIKMQVYRTALEALGIAHDTWRQDAGIEQIEKQSWAAGKTTRATWKALIAYAKAHPKDAVEISRHGATLNNVWEAAELFRAIGFAGKAVR